MLDILKLDHLFERDLEIIYDCECRSVKEFSKIIPKSQIHHHKIALYGSLWSLARALGLNEAVEPLEQAMNEEKAAAEYTHQSCGSTRNSRHSRDAYVSDAVAFSPHGIRHPLPDPPAIHETPTRLAQPQFGSAHRSSGPARDRGEPSQTKGRPLHFSARSCRANSWRLILFGISLTILSLCSRWFALISYQAFLRFGHCILSLHAPND
jgi:Domain of unknown function (DUF892)